MEIFSPLFETYSIGFISLTLSNSYISFFSNFFDPTHPFLVPSSSWPIPIAKTWKLSSIPCNLVSSRPNKKWNNSVPMLSPSIQQCSPQWRKSNNTWPPSLNLLFWCSTLICISLQITLYLTHLCILKLKIALIPITFNTITFNVTYAFRRCMWPNLMAQNPLVG